jgi:probable F420-dependent oxidoreductase
MESGTSGMNIGLVYPQTEFPTDPGAVRDYAQTAEGLGFSHILAYDHVLGANPERPGGWTGPYTYRNPFHEPFVLFSYMAGLTTRVGFMTGILILPQRQTALVAKQAASLDALSGGRLRLGVGTGWNAVEYAALNEDFHNRGRRLEEQVTLLRDLWTKPLVNFTGRWHTIPDAGILPLPVQRPIPIWFGGYVDSVLRRAARMADGWLPGFRTAAEAKPTLEKLAGYVAEAGRAPGSFGLEPRLPYGDGDPSGWAQAAEDWRAAGATHLSFNSMGQGFSTAAGHLKAAEAFARAAGL